MALIVQKYGGTSVGTTERIRSVAGRIARFKAAGHQLVVVVSAMSGETDRLISLAKEVQPDPDPREFDVVVSTGEQVTIGLLCMALLALHVAVFPNSRGSGSGWISLARATSLLVSPLIAETTTTSSCPAALNAEILPATLLMRSVVPTEVPPNF